MYRYRIWDEANYGILATATQSEMIYIDPVIAFEEGELHALSLGCICDVVDEQGKLIIDPWGEWADPALQWLDGDIVWLDREEDGSKR